MLAQRSAPDIIYEPFRGRMAAGASDVLPAAARTACIGAIVWGSVVALLQLIGWMRGTVALGLAVAGVAGFALLGGVLAFVVAILPREFYLQERRSVAVRQTAFRRLLLLSGEIVRAEVEPSTAAELVRVVLRNRQTNSMVLIAWLSPEGAAALARHLEGAASAAAQRSAAGQADGAA